MIRFCLALLMSFISLQLIADDWAGLTVEQQAAVRENNKRWKAMTKDQKHELHQRYIVYESLSHTQKALVQKNVLFWKSLNVAQREQLRQRLEIWSGLPSEEQQNRLDLLKKP